MKTRTRGAQHMIDVINGNASALSSAYNKSKVEKVQPVPNPYDKYIRKEK